MIELYDKIIPDSTYTETVYRFTEENDTLIIKNSGPVIGAKKVLSVSIETTEGSGYTLDKYFRYTLEGLVWSEWKVLSEENLKSIDIRKNHFFDIEYKVICKKQDTERQTSFPEFKKISLVLDYDIPEEPEFYSNHFFSKYFSFLNYDSIKWTRNLLQKIYKSGILAKYIERKDNRNWSDEDFIDFWWSVIYVVSLRLTYNSVYSNIYWYPELLKKYLQQKGIFFGSEIRLDECAYLMQYYYDEISRRGSLSVLDSKRELPENFENVSIRGELLRLIDKGDIDEFLSAIIEPFENGWVVGKTCPLFSETDTYKGYVKGYELGEEVKDLSVYPLEDLSKYEIVDFNDKKVIHFSSSGGIGSKTIGMSMTKLLNIDSSFSYEISLKFSTNSKTVLLVAGARSRDSLGAEIENPFTQDSNISINTRLDIKNEDSINTVSFVVLDKNSEYSIGNNKEYEPIELEGLFGKRNLQFKKEDVSKFLDPFILLEGEEGTDFYIWDIKVKLLDKKPIFISSIQEILLYLKNNNYLYTLDELKEIIGTYLLPFTMNLTLKGYE